MEWTRSKIRVALATSAIIAVSVVALVGLPQAVGAAHVSSTTAEHAMTAARGWFPPMAQRSFGPTPASSWTLHTVRTTSSAHEAWASAASSAGSESYATGPVTGHWMHHCGFMPRYNQLRA